MILLNLDRSSKVPLFMQIFNQLKQRIDDEILKPGFRMPPTREFAEKHGINRTTVVKAYEELWALGYLESRPGSYSIVRKRQKLATPERKSDKGLIRWKDKSTEAGLVLHDSFHRLNIDSPAGSAQKPIDLASLDLDQRLFPMEGFRRCLNTVMVEQGGKILKYGECAGYTPLRESIAERMRVHGISVEPGEILVTNGTQNSIELILKLLTVPGTPAAVETPTYTNIIPLLHYYKTKILEIPMTDEGMDLDELRRTLDTRSPAFIYTMPNFHNPTGITTNQIHREKLLDICETRKVPLVEDAFEEEMKYFGKVPLPIKSMDNHHMVVYLGTFSKILFPGIRVGWIAAEKSLIQRLLAIKKFSDLSSNNLVQAALHLFLKEGYYDRHVKRMRREFRKRMTIALTALKEQLSPFDRVVWKEPAGGYLIWLRFDGTRMSSPEMRRLFLEHGVNLVPGSHFFNEPENQSPGTGASGHYYRVSISTLDGPEIREGISRLGRAISEMYRE
jgi:DNA-binding transcriptional MocR family regulator